MVFVVLVPRWREGWVGRLVLSCFSIEFFLFPVVSYYLVVQLVICWCFLTYMSQWVVVAPLARPLASLCAWL
jgi:hypothetical protein